MKTGMMVVLALGIALIVLLALPKLALATDNSSADPVALAQSADLPEQLDVHPGWLKHILKNTDALIALAQHPRLDEIAEDHPHVLDAIAAHPRAAEFLVDHPG